MCRDWCAQACAFGKDFIFSIEAHTTKLCENMCNQQPYIYRELTFCQLTSGGGDAKLTLDNVSRTLKTNELNYLLANIAVTENQLARYIIAQHDVMSYVTAATGTNLIVQPRPDASGCALHDVFLDELKGDL